MEEVKSSPTPPLVPDRLPTVALRDLVFFPKMVLPLLVGRPRSVAALGEAIEPEGHGYLLLVAQRDAGSDEPSAQDLHRVGTVVRVVQSTRLDDDTLRVLFEGVRRVRVDRFLPGPGPFRADIQPLVYPDLREDTAAAGFQAVVRRAERCFRDYAHAHPDLPSDIASGLSDSPSPERAAHLIAGHLLIGVGEKQLLLEMETLEAMFSELLEILDRELEILKIEDDLDREMREKMDDDRRQHYLREQLKAIQRELGGEAGEWGDLETRLEQIELPKAARGRAEHELGRAKQMSPLAPEAGVIRGYLDWILSLPWSERTEDNSAMTHARSVLEEAHFGLDEVKDRILDHIAVLTLVGRLQGSILCLVGPPGVGKTSLGRSMARALDRQFVRVALGGVRDEAEIRGHRRTYVGSLPGRILQGIRRAGAGNPVFLLDEVDKLAKDGLGDPSAALLEVLDPEQNRTFQDHYLELEFDLSDVLFVATANTLSGIPDPLRDRMEIIRIPGYLDTEKQIIARDFLIPEQIRRHGLSTEQVRLSHDVVDEIISHYTREAGVRELDRMLARVTRKMARRIVEASGDQLEKADVTVEDLMGFLGPRRHHHTSPAEGRERVGIATGLAWTVAGGEVLEVEVSVVPGSGAIQLTGTLGDVMKESAVAAVTFSRSRARELGLRTHFHREVDIHIHIPEGATPKDGPSAGITIAAALISALTGTPIRSLVAMTGEITLRGRVLPVGGIKEKAVAALRNGVRMIILPAGNLSEVDLLPPEVLSRVTFQAVERMDQVLDLVLSAPPGLDATAGSAMAGLMPGALDPGPRPS
jgi:ATP-dependent Lon protease